MIVKQKACCFFGHRKIPSVQYNRIVERLESEIIKLINLGVRRFYAGSALGLDTFAALIVLGLREKHPHIRLLLVLPCLEQTKQWEEIDKEIYNMIWKRADRVIYTSENYYQGCMQKRNRYMVDNGTACICYLTETTGGTAYTVDYAKKHVVNVINLAQS